MYGYAAILCLLCLNAAWSSFAPSLSPSSSGSVTAPSLTMTERRGETQPQDLPLWGPQSTCSLNRPNPFGLHPGALQALKQLQAAHRITQGINLSSERGNVHGPDGQLNGTDYTGAVDISVRCLSDEQIKVLLGRLAESGFAAWYRKGGEDGWRGVSHIHAVWAGCRLKLVLQRQVESWLNGKNGLVSNTTYRFWQSSAEQKSKVQTLYQSAH